jgi:hypothetical protein
MSKLSKKEFQKQVLPWHQHRLIMVQVLNKNFKGGLTSLFYFQLFYFSSYLSL